MDRRFGLVERFVPAELKGKGKDNKVNRAVWDYVSKWCFRYNTSAVWNGTASTFLSQLTAKVL